MLNVFLSFINVPNRLKELKKNFAGCTKIDGNLEIVDAKEKGLVFFTSNFGFGFKYYFSTTLTKMPARHNVGFVFIIVIVNSIQNEKF